MTLREHLDILEHRYCIKDETPVDAAINDLIKMAIKDSFNEGIKFTGNVVVETVEARSE